MSTDIEWTRGDDGSKGRTWNPTTGCDRTSPGCDNCYALTMAARLKGMGQAKYQRDGDPRTSGPGFGITEHPDTLDAPLRWRKPTRVFVNSMSDLFHSGVSDEFIARVWAVMAMTPQHTYQLLTKRHGRMHALLNSERWPGLLFDAVRWLVCEADTNAAMPPERIDAAHQWVTSPERRGEAPPPLRNAWLGVSAENQKWADLRIPALLGTPAAVRFVSAEPLLGPIDFDDIARISTLGPDWAGGPGGGTGAPHPLLDWVIVGGESGPGAREMNLGWVRSIVEQCRRDDVAVFVKQLGSIHGRALGGGKGGDPDFWPEGLNLREFPQVVSG